MARCSPVSNVASDVNNKNPPPFTLMHGESRTSIPPPLQERSGVAFKEPTFDDTTWESVDAPHDFIKNGTEINPFLNCSSSHLSFIDVGTSLGFGWARRLYNCGL
jgi:hypothetical protein